VTKPLLTPDRGASAAVLLALPAAAAVLGVLAVLSPLAALAAAVALVFAAVALVNLAAGVCLLTVLSFFEGIPGLSGPVFSAAKIGGVVVVLSWLLLIGRRPRDTPLLLRERPLLAYAAVFLVTWSFASRLWATSSPKADESSLSLALGVILVFVVFTAIREPRHFRWLVWAFLLGALLSAVIGLLHTSPEGSRASAEEGRLTGGIEDPNELAAILVPAVVLACFALAAVRGALARWALVLCALVCTVALLLTESRGGLVALAVALVAAVLLAGRLRAGVLAIGLVIAALGVSYYVLVAPPQSLQRLTQFYAGGGTGRTDLWSIAVQMIGDNPVVGVGAGNFQVREPFYASGTINLPEVQFVIDTPKVVHNTYLEVLVQLGVLGLAAFGGLVLGSLALALRRIRAFAEADAADLEVLARGFLTALIAMLAAFAFISAEYEKQLWLFVGLAAALPSVAVTARRERAAEGSPD
jgi:O-antigen ligase